MKSLIKLISSSIKNKILSGYVILIIIPLITVAIFNYVSTSRIIEDKTEKQLGEVSRAINEQFDQYFVDVDAITYDIIKNSEIQKRLNESYVEVGSRGYYNLVQETAIADYFRGITDRKPGIFSIILFGYNGMNAYYHPQMSWNFEYDATKDEWFKKTQEADGKWVLTGKRNEKQLFSMDSIASPEVISFSRVVKDVSTYKALGMIQINIDLKYISNMVLRGVEEGSVSILNNNDELIVSDKNIDTRNALEISDISPMTGWKTIYHAPKDELLREVGDIRNIIVIITLISIAVAMILANIISWGIAKPVNVLKTKMRSVGQGDFESFIELRKDDEIGELINGFNLMVRKIKLLVSEIRQKEDQRLRTELAAQQARINPHFMYNTLNNFRWMAMMDGNNEMAKKLTSFVYLLKFAAKNNRPLITIRDEICILEAYSDLMKMRYTNFELRTNIDDEALNLITIPFLLQPIIENAIFHGVSLIQEKGFIDVSLSKKEDKVVVIVKDNGLGMEKEILENLFNDNEDDSGCFNKVGVKNVYDRLKLQFSEKADLTVNSWPGQGTEVVISWPAICKEEKQNG